MDKHADMIRFGNDGWKARYDDGFTPENAARLADALGCLWADEGDGATVYVGYDTRIHSAEIARDVAGVLSSNGLRAKLAYAACPLPALAWSCAHDDAAVGAVMITASELSCEYGGIVVRGSDGGPCNRSFLDDIEQMVPASAQEARGRIELCDVVESYVEDLLASVHRPLGRPLKVVVDPMYGSAAGVMSRALRELGCEVIEIHALSLGDFGGIHPSPTDPWADECEQTVVAENADLGIVLDCDGDRAGIVDEKGRLLAVRELVPLVVEALAAKAPAQNRVVATLTSSALIERQAERLGLGYTPVSVGFYYIYSEIEEGDVYSEIEEGDVLLGAEEYGGICVPSHLKERDGIYACLRVVEYLASQALKLSELMGLQGEALGKTFWSRRDVRLEPASAQVLRTVLPGLNPPSVAGREPIDVSHADGLKLSFSDGSWVLARPARTDPVVRVYAEAPDAAERDALIGAICDSVAVGPTLS